MFYHLHLINICYRITKCYPGLISLNLSAWQLWKQQYFVQHSHHRYTCNHNLSSCLNRPHNSCVCCSQFLGDGGEDTSPFFPFSLLPTLPSSLLWHSNPSTGAGAGGGAGGQGDRQPPHLQHRHHHPHAQGDRRNHLQSLNVVDPGQHRHWDPCDAWCHQEQWPPSGEYRCKSAQTVTC